MPHSLPDNCKISAVIPAYNEKENLLILIPELVRVLSSFTDYEIVLVDDGSTDGTSELCADFCARFPSFKCISLKKNHGLSTALAAGFDNSTGDIILTMDADLQYSVDDIPKLLESFSDEVDMVCGYRSRRDDPVSKKISSKIANAVKRFILKDEVKDAGCIFRVFRRSSLKSMVLFRGFHRFMPSLFEFEELKIVHVPVGHFPRKYGKSKYAIANRLFATIYDLIGVSWLKKRCIRYSVKNKDTDEKK